ncbi:Acetylcholinesterase [Echinococcus granulosus]|nr:Acetylcholinesterase [Echinococcus granulosus]
MYMHKAPRPEVRSSKMRIPLSSVLILLAPTALASIFTTQVGNVVLNLSERSSLMGTGWNISGIRVDAYLGIPFAKPPVGNLRFAPPVEADLWEGQLDATKLPNSCWQYRPGNFDVTNPAARIWINNTEMSEDCLYLNVWVPSRLQGHNASLPVMVWIFGGGFFSGTSTLDVYDGRYLAAMENVIVVSMQYRLGPFGFLFVESQIGGNMGLLDQQLALKWVRKHISAFTGDPGLVTLFGESAGAVSVGLHYLAPSSRSLFQRMILQSSSPLSRWALWQKPVAHEAGISFIKASNCADRLHDLGKEVACLRRLPASSVFDTLSELTLASTKRRASRLSTMSSNPQWPVPFLTDASQYFDVYMRPVLDGNFLPDCPGTILSSISSYEAPDVLIGNVANEGIYWLLYGLGITGINFLYENGTVTQPSLEDLRRAKIDYLQLVQTRFMSIGHLLEPFPAIATLQYGFNSPNIPKVTSYNTGLQYNSLTSTSAFLDRLDDLSGEVDFICPTLLFARLLSKIGGSSVQFYNFIHRTSGCTFPEWTGVMHGYEIEYVFGMPFSQTFTSKYYNFTNQEAELSLRVMRYWANFAKNGKATTDPKGIEVNENWPDFRVTDESYLEIGLNTSTVKESPHDKGCTFWNDIFPSLQRIYLQRSGYKSYPQSGSSAVCPYMEVDLYPVERLRDFVTGEYPDGSERLMLPWVIVFVLLWMLV